MLRNCAFCGAKVIKVKTMTRETRGKIRELVHVKGGYLVFKQKTAQLPVCDDCWHRAVDYLGNNVNPLRKILVVNK